MHRNIKWKGFTEELDAQLGCWRQNRGCGHETFDCRECDFYSLRRGSRNTNRGRGIGLAQPMEMVRSFECWGANQESEGASGEKALRQERYSLQPQSLGTLSKGHGRVGSQLR